MKLLRAALCSNEAENPDIVIEVPNELQDDADIVELASTIAAPDEGVVAASAALESLFEVHRMLQMNRGAFALESMSESNVALEGKIIDAIRNGFDNYFQHVVLSNKHQNDIFIDFWKSTSSKISKYSQALDKTEAEFVEKSSKFRQGDHHASLIQLWYFFSTKTGPSRNVIADLDNDTDHSAYVLTEYPKAVLGALNKLNGVLRNAKLDSDKNAASFFSAVEKLPSIEDLFNSHHLGDGILFNVTSVERQIKTTPSVIDLNGHKFTQLAELAARATVIENKSTKHTAWKVLSQTGIGHAIKENDREDFVLSTKEIEELIKFGKQYIHNVEGYLSLKNEIERVFRDTQSAIEKLQRTAVIDNVSVRQGIKQVTAYLTNLSKAITTPAADEVVRSIKGAKYCNYLALRMIYNASKYF